MNAPFIAIVPAVEISEDEAFAPIWSRKDDPWSSPSWKRAAADYHHSRPQRPQHNLPPKWDTASIGALWHCLNNPRRFPNAGKATCDALLYELRTYGAAQLAKPNCQSRLTELSTPQLRELIAALTRLKPNCRVIDDTLLLKLGKLL